MAKPKIEFSEVFKRAFHRTLGALSEEVNESKVVMAELVLDANRMVTFGGDDGKAADDEAARLINKHGWITVRNAAAKEFC